MGDSEVHELGNVGIGQPIQNKPANPTSGDQAKVT